MHKDLKPLPYGSVTLKDALQEYEEAQRKLRDARYELDNCTSQLGVALQEAVNKDFDAIFATIMKVMTKHPSILHQVVRTFLKEV